jgi:hypothetical protein
MHEEEYFGVVPEVNSAYLKSIAGLMKPYFLYNLEYFSDIESGNYSHYEEYIKAEFRQSSSSYAIN